MGTRQPQGGRGEDGEQNASGINLEDSAVEDDYGDGIDVSTAGVAHVKSIASPLPKALDGRTSVGGVLSITGDFDPQLATDALGIAPTEQWRKGDFVPYRYRLRPEKESCWAVWLPFVDPFDPFKTVGDILTPLADMLVRRADAWHTLHASTACEAWLAAVVYLYEGSVPAIHFEPSFLAAVGALRVGLDVDVIRVDGEDDDV